MSHTEGKLSIDRHGNIKTEDQDDFRVRGATLSGRDVAEANTRRLVACWNEHDDLVKERDEALDVLRELAHGEYTDELGNRAVAILAKHQKGTDHAK